MTPEDRRAIEGLFQRLAEVERGAEPRDAEAEALIRDLLARQPAAAYYMAQTVLVQETALREARRQIDELEAEQHKRPAPGPWSRQDGAPRRGGSGFLANAAQTALGVTGGMLLGSAIASLFTGTAEADEPPADDYAADDSAPDDGGWDDGGFDIGGDF